MARAELAMEKCFVTQNFSIRLLITVLGMTLGNAYAAYNRFVEKTQDTFLEAVNDIAYDGMHNDENASPPATQPNPTSPAEDTTAGARSPFRSPTREAARHALLPLRLVPGFVGYKQQACSVCGETGASFCCGFCSNADKIFVLCNPNKRACLTDHKADPCCADHRYRRPSGHGSRSGSGESKAKKRARKEAARAASAPSAKSRKPNGKATGCRSGASAEFDPRSFRARMRVRGGRGG